MEPTYKCDLILEKGLFAGVIKLKFQNEVILDYPDVP